jgi:YD repeat-containing protein
VQYSYDSRNNTTTSTNARGNVTVYVYDGRNRLIETDRLLTDTGLGSGTVIGIITNRQSWDDSSRMTNSVDGNGNITRYQYDSLNRLILITYADGTTNAYYYDWHDNITGCADGNGTFVVTGFDLLNRPTNLTIYRGPGVLGTTNESYSYDGASRVVEAINSGSYVSNRYDSLSHLISELRASALGVYTLPMEYDALGNLTRVPYLNGPSVVQTFDSLNRLKVSRFDPPGPGSTNAVFQYIGPNRIARIDYGNGTRMDATYEALPRVRTIQHSLTNTPFYYRQFSWDPSHNLVVNSNMFVTNQLQYQYDSLDRLVRTDNSDFGLPTTYNLDAVGNRTYVSQGPGAGFYSMSNTPPQLDFQVNQYTIGPSNTARLYDGNGNLIAANGHTNNYDFRNRLVQVDGGQVVFKYDAEGQCIEKDAYSGTNYYIQAAGIQIAEFFLINQDYLIASYVWGGGLLLQTTATNGQHYFYHADQLASPVAITDTNGNLVEACSYDEYGTPYQASSIIGNPFRYRALRFDPQIAWYVPGELSLDPAAGRFISRTPGTLAGPYAFAANNPVSPYASAQNSDDDFDEEPPPHFECGQHYLWWIQHHRRGHHPRPPRSTIPIEIVSLGLEGVPAGPTTGPCKEPMLGGCPGLPDPKRSHDFDWPLALPESDPGPGDDPPGKKPPGKPPVKPPDKPQDKPPDRKKDDDKGKLYMATVAYPKRKCVKMEKELPSREEWVDVPLTLKYLDGRFGWMVHKKVRIYEKLVWDACDVGGGMFEMFNEHVEEIKREDVGSPKSSIKEQPIRGPEPRKK